MRRDPPSALALAAPAKVNLFLELVSRRTDGYHELRTLMAALSLHDTLVFQGAPPGTFRLSCSDPTLGTGAENLIVRAAESLRRLTGTDAGADIALTKRIPREAGLAGGSSDAASTLIGLDRLWNLGLGREGLLPLAAELGSDVAFFLTPTAAWCTGRGEIVTPCPLGARLHLVLLCPPFGLSTAAVYKLATVPDAPLDGEAIRAAATAGDAEALGRLLHNRLWEPARRVRPEVDEWLERLRATDPLGCLMSGSGSTLFALARDRRDARRIAAAVNVGRGERVQVVRSRA